MEGFFCAQICRIILITCISIGCILILSMAPQLNIAYQLNRKAMITLLLFLAILVCMWLIYKSVDWFEKI